VEEGSNSYEVQQPERPKMSQNGNLKQMVKNILKSFRTSPHLTNVI